MDEPTTFSADRSDWGHKLAVLSYCLAVAAPLLHLLYIIAYIRAAYAPLGLWPSVFTLLIRLLAPVAIVLGFAVLTLSAFRPVRGRSYALAAVVVGMPANLVVWTHVAMVQNLSPAQHKANCQGNLKELGTAVILYCEDYNGTLPSSTLYRRSAKWNKADFINFAKRQGKPESQQASWPVLLYPYLRDRRAVWCPSDRERSLDADARVSYYWKAAVDRAWYGGFREISDFAYPADQMILYEHADRHWGDPGKGLFNDVTINCAFIDGHVGTKRIKNSGYTSAENPPEPLPKSGVGEPAWFNGAGSAEYAGDWEALRTNTGANWHPRKWMDCLP